MSVRIIAKKAYEFSAAEGSKIIKVKVEPFIVTTVPDWVVEHDLFKLAQKNGNAEVMGETTSDLSMSEIEELQEKAKEYGIKNYKNMKLDTLKIKIAEAEAELKTQNSGGE